MKKFLNFPQVYQSYQELGGFFQARVKAMQSYFPILPGARVIDIGCGPGHIVRHMPLRIDYIGLDIDEPSIRYAKEKFGKYGRFAVRFFDADAVMDFGPADHVLMNGVMHHIGDEDLKATLLNIHAVLKPGGSLFTLDGCYATGQSRVAKWLLDNDRGKYVRSAEQYQDLLEGIFASVEMHVRDDLSRLPYTFAIGVAR